MLRKLRAHSAVMTVLISGVLSGSVLMPVARGEVKTQQRLEDATEVFSRSWPLRTKGFRTTCWRRLTAL